MWNTPAPGYSLVARVTVRRCNPGDAPELGLVFRCDRTSPGAIVEGIGYTKHIALILPPNGHSGRDVTDATRPWLDSMIDDPYVELRRAMVDAQIRRRGIADERVLAAMENVPRHEFVPPQYKSKAYEDEPLPIGGGQTISQPYIAAAMTAALRLGGRETVLEIGTGCGYQAAVLSLLAQKVFTVEWRAELARAAEENLQRLGFRNVQVRCGDGSLGLAEFAPYGAILVAAAAPALPAPLLEQLDEGGRMIAPVGREEHQHLLLVTKTGSTWSTEKRDSCRFVPLLGQHGWKPWELL